MYTYNIALRIVISSCNNSNRLMSCQLHNGRIEGGDHCWAVFRASVGLKNQKHEKYEKIHIHCLGLIMQYIYIILEKYLSICQFSQNQLGLISRLNP